MAFFTRTLTITLLLCILSAAVLADVGRKLDMENKRNEIVIRADAEGSSSDKSRIEFELEHLTGGQGMAEADFRYYLSAGGSSDAFRTRFLLKSITEFADANNNGVFDRNETTYTVYTTDGTGNRDWNDFVMYNATASNGALVYHFAATTKDNVLTVRGHIASSVDPTQPLYNPSSVKIDVEVRNFPWTGPSTTKLALESRVRTKSEVREQMSSQRVTVTNSASPILGYVDWKATASSETGDVAVLAAPLSNEGTDSSGDNDWKLNFVFNSDTHKTSYVWDPAIGAPAATVSSFIAALF